MPNISSSAWHYLVQLSLQNYVAGRLAALNRLHPVAPTLLHHAVELILKAALSRNQSLLTLRRKYGHDLKALWKAVTAVNPNLVTGPRAQTVAALDKFEDLRYPDSVISKGAVITFAFDSGGNPTSSGPCASRVPRYQFNLEDIDELWAALFHNTGANPAAFLQVLSDSARRALDTQNRHPVQPQVPSPHDAK